MCCWSRSLVVRFHDSTAAVQPRRQRRVEALKLRHKPFRSQMPSEGDQRDAKNRATPKHRTHSAARRHCSRGKMIVRAGEASKALRTSRDHHNRMRSRSKRASKEQEESACRKLRLMPRREVRRKERMKAVRRGQSSSAEHQPPLCEREERTDWRVLAGRARARTRDRRLLVACASRRRRQRETTAERARTRWIRREFSRRDLRRLKLSSARAAVATSTKEPEW